MRVRVLALVVVVLSGCAVVQRVSITPSGEPNGASVQPALNADATVTAFASIATNLVGGDTNAVSDVFARDATGAVRRVSVGPAGVQANGPSSHPSVSADGRFIAFQSDATNLVAGDTNATTDVFVRDRTASTTTLVSAPAPGAPAVTPASAVSGSTASAVPAPTLAARNASLRARAAAAPVRVIVRTATTFRGEGDLSANARVNQRTEIRAAHDRVATTIGSAGRVVARAKTLPIVVAEVDATALDRLEASPDVVGITPDDPVPAAMVNSGPVVGLPDAHDAGYTGRGVAVAILDTGVDSAHPFLGGRVVSESCFSGLNHCPNGLATQSGSGAAAPCTYAPSGCRHGTHVAGIAAGGALAADGVAPRASIIAVQIFSKFSGPLCTRGENPCPLTLPSDWILGLEHVYELRNTFNIAAVNMSIGGLTSMTACDTDPVKPAIDQLESVGIATIIAAGNNGLTNAIDYPACISTSVAVGATNNVDAIASFSNSHPLVDLFAPGVAVRSSVPGGGFALFSGTSMATPHVAGAWALAKEQDPTASVDEVLERMRSTGRTIHDPRNGLDIPRLCTAGALGFDRCPNRNGSRHPSISGDGTIVAFESDAALVSTDTNTTTDIYRRDLSASSPTRISVSTAGAQGLGRSTHPSTTVDGQRIAFDSTAAELVSGDTNGVSDVFVHDLAATTTSRVSVASPGGLQVAEPSRDAAISSNGDVVAFTSQAQLSTLDTNAVADIYTVEGTAPTLISQAPGFGAANGPSRRPSIQYDGTRVAFESDATNLATNLTADTNNATDIYIRHRGSSITQRVSTGVWLTGGNGPSGSPALSRDGADIAFASNATDFVDPLDTNRAPDIYIRPALTPTVEAPSPTTIARGAQNLPFTVTGRGFDFSAVVNAGPGVTVTITDRGATLLSGSISVATSARSGTRNLTVVNLGSSGFSTGLCVSCLTIT